MSLFRLWAELFRLGHGAASMIPRPPPQNFGRHLATLTDQGQISPRRFYALLAELEAETFGAERALARIDEAFALAHQLGRTWNSRSSIACAAKSF